MTSQNDLLDIGDIRAAMEGVRRAYFVYPPQGELLVEATTIMATAARDAGVETVVNMSQISARERARSPLSRQHWLSEKILDWADIGAVHLRPTFFENESAHGQGLSWRWRGGRSAARRRARDPR